MEALAQSLSITYTFAKKTLTAPEIDAAHKQVLDTLATKVKDLKFR